MNNLCIVLPAYVGSVIGMPIDPLINLFDPKAHRRKATEILLNYPKDPKYPAATKKLQLLLAQFNLVISRQGKPQGVTKIL